MKKPRACYYHVSFCILVSTQVLIAQEKMATNTVYVFAKKDSKYAYTGECRSCLENSSRPTSTIWVSMLARGGQVCLSSNNPLAGACIEGCFYRSCVFISFTLQFWKGFYSDGKLWEGEILWKRVLLCHRLHLSLGWIIWGLKGWLCLCHSGVGLKILEPITVNESLKYPNTFLLSDKRQQEHRPCLCQRQKFQVCFAAHVLIHT